MTVSRQLILCRLLLGSCVLPAACLGGVGKAQEVVQSLPDPASEELSGALQRLSSNPNSVSALVDAGRASLELGDNASALGFFNRAQRIAPEDGRVLAGLGVVALRRGDAVTALQLFTNANAAGEPMSPLAAERALAFDLVGQNARAQRLYRMALGRENSADVTRQLALSHAITGDEQLSEDLLLPLLQQQDRGAFRTRAFALAILGKGDEAVTIAEAMLPPRTANKMAEYLRFMPRLTPAQQAAAANLGRFPASAQIGQDDPRLAALGIEESVESSVRRRPAISAPIAQANARTGADQRLIPEGEPFGPAEIAIADIPDVPAVSEVSEAVEVAALDPVSGELPAVGRPVELAVAQRNTRPEVRVPAASTPPLPARPNLAERSSALASAIEAQSIPAGNPAATEQISPARASNITAPITEPIATVVETLEDASSPAEAPRPSFSLSDQAEEQSVSTSARAEPNAGQVAEPITEEPEDLGSIFAEFAAGENSADVEVAAGAVDITSIEPAREEIQPESAPIVEAKPQPPQHPARHWVQLGIGRNISAFNGDIRRYRRAAEGLLDGRDAYSAPLNRTNRLLIGPFDTARAANKFVSELKEVGVDSYRFSSSQGEEVKPL